MPAARAQVPASQEAVDIYRELVAVHPVFLPDLANSLVAHGIRPTEHSQIRCCADCRPRGSGVYATLASSDSARYRGSWERAVDKVVVELKHLGWSQQAIADERSRLGMPDG
jgi:hypothetical protein